MGNIDANCHTFLSKAENFADLCNGYLYGGVNIIAPDDLVTEDSRIISKNKTRYVDIIKKHINQTSISILVLENQNKIDYSMPIRNMLNEAIIYNKQLENCKDIHKINKDLSKDEYLLGISKNDLFNPVIIIVFYLGDDKWNGPKCLYDMLDLDDRIKKYVNNYRLNILDYHNYKNFDNYSGDVKNLLALLATKTNKSKMKSIISNIGYVDYDTAELLAGIIGIRNIDRYIIKTDSERKIDMCKALDELVMDGVKLGEKRGKKLGREEGIKLGEKRGVAIGEKRGVAIGEKRGVAIGEKRGVAIGEKRGVAIGEKRGVAIGEKRGVAIGEKRGKQLGREEGLEALVNSIKEFLPDFDSVYKCVIKNKPYKNLTKEEVRKYY